MGAEYVETIFETSNVAEIQTAFAAILARSRNENGDRGGSGTWVEKDALEMLPGLHLGAEAASAAVRKVTAKWGPAIGVLFTDDVPDPADLADIKTMGRNIDILAGQIRSFEEGMGTLLKSHALELEKARAEFHTCPDCRSKVNLQRATFHAACLCPVCGAGDFLLSPEGKRAYDALKTRRDALKNDMAQLKADAATLNAKANMPRCLVGAVCCT